MAEGYAASGGVGGGPTPWWQLPGQNVANLDASAPDGYQYDRVQMRYVPILGSPTDALAQRTRSQGIQDQLLRELSFGGSSDQVNVAPTPWSQPIQYAPVSSSVPSFSAPGPTTQPMAPTIQAPDTSAAQAAIFARAKDKVGLETQGSLTALRSALAGRGLAGGGAEVKGASNVLTAGAGQLGDTTREQAIQEAQRQNDFAQLGYKGAIEQRGQDITTAEGAANRSLEAAKTAYEGNLTQRSQNIGQNTAAANVGVTQRGQDVQSAIANLQARTAQRGQNLSATGTLLSKLY